MNLMKKGMVTGVDFCVSEFPSFRKEVREAAKSWEEYTAICVAPWKIVQWEEISAC
jgi:hypothetical protein